MITVTKGDITIRCDTQADLKIVMATLNHEDEPPIPEWRVGGPSDV